LNKTTSIDLDLKERIAIKCYIPKETYAELKGELMLPECLKEFFQRHEYQRELTEVINCIPKNSPAPFKYQIETIEKIAKGKFPLVETGKIGIEV
jgi:predicted DNA-binding protein (UPF0278 family)